MRELIQRQSLTDSVKTPKRHRRGEGYIERNCRNGPSPWFHEIKMNRHTFVSVNRMTAGHYSLIARYTGCPRRKGQYSVRRTAVWTGRV
jgi:hypothetical protein